MQMSQDILTSPSKKSTRGTNNVNGGFIPIKCEPACLIPELTDTRSNY